MVEQKKLSRIKRLLLRNFRNIEQEVIEFDKNIPIITLIGDNEAGKSSFTFAMQTLGANLYPKDQKDFIKTGASQFFVAMNLDDENDTVVYRAKGDGFNGYGIYEKGVQTWCIPKMEDSTVPPKADELIGFILEPETKELLNIRMYFDQQIFINTSSSTNYKVIYSALKIDQLKGATQKGNSELNILRKTVREIENSVDTLQCELSNIRLMDLSPLMALREKLIKYREMASLLETAMGILNEVRQIDSSLGVMQNIGYTEAINELEVEYVNYGLSLTKEVNQLTRSLDIYQTTYGCEDIDIEQLYLFNTGENVLQELRSMNCDLYTEINTAKELDMSLIEDSNRALVLLSEISKLDMGMDSCDVSCSEVLNIDMIDLVNKGQSLLVDIGDITVEVGDLNIDIEKSEELLKSYGVRVVTCSNCGDSVVVEQFT